MKTVIKVDNLSQTIKKISEQGINYTVNGEDYFVNFADCYENYLHSIKDKSISEAARISKRVGERNISTEPPYIEFFTTPVIRFEFKFLNDFHELRHRTRKKGWTTMDLS